jgi:DNA/RNA-binding domain of Phe-tRNA-synthetase-like protein
VSEDPQLGWTAPEVAAELPELRLWHLRAKAVPGPSPVGLREQLRSMSDRFHGAKAIALRRDPIPHAYRVLYRHIGLDPDDARVPIEAAAVARLKHGGFKSDGLVDDALLIALVETGVPVWALDDDRVEGDLGIRLAWPGEELGDGEHAPVLGEGRLVVADDRAAVAELFGDLAPGLGVTPETTALRLFTVQAPGVPAIHVEESLWMASEALDSA